MIRLSSILVLLLALISSVSASADTPLKEKDYSWMEHIRPEHPRMFLTKEDIPQIRRTAFSFENKTYTDMKNRADKLLDPATGKPYPIVFEDPLAKTGEGKENRNYGFYAADAALMWLISGEQKYFHLARYILQELGHYYQLRVDNNLNIEWAAFSQICAMAAYDWIYNDLKEYERDRIGRTLFNALCDVAWHGPGIREARYRENVSAPTSGCYGVTVLPWYVGLTFYGEGYDDSFCQDMVRNGYDFHKEMTDFRSMMAGKNGGGASGAVNYSLAGYPFAEYDFIYTFRSATGIDISDRMEYMVGYLNYMDWMRLPGNKEFGFGDTNHYKCNLPHPYMNLHVKMLADIFGDRHPEILPVAARMLTQFKSRRLKDEIPFIRLLIRKDPSRADGAGQSAMRKSVYFETMGQLCMRSGTGDDDTYVMFVSGGIPKNHKHYDNNHFIIYKNGYRALDSGTRPEPGWHLPYYYARTVAHNAVTIKMPGEVFPEYWGGPAAVEDKNLKMPNDGGQCGLLDSKLLEHVETEDYVYIASDATKCYHEDKADLVVREFIWFAPDLFLVFDRMVSDNPEYEKRWLYHTSEEPDIRGLQFSEKSQGGKSVVCTLFPQDAKVEKIGGPGKQFWSDGRNWSLPELTPEDYGYANRGAVPPNNWPLVGQWRVEVKPARPSKEDYFMHMIQVGEESMGGLPKTKTFEDDKFMGVEFRYAGKKYNVTFDKTAVSGCKITVR